MKTTGWSARPFAGPRRKVLLPIVLVALALIAVAVWAWDLGAERRAIEQLPPEERHALFERTRANVDTLCRPEAESGGLRLCREQAKLLLAFPECDEACRRRALEILKPATR
jgi:hypothetical protein